MEQLQSCIKDIKKASNFATRRMIFLCIKIYSLIEISELFRKVAS